MRHSFASGFLLGLSLVLSPAKGASTTERKPLIASTQPAGTLRDEATVLENDVAILIERRPDSPPAVSAVADLQIDLRVLSHAMLLRAAEDKVDPAIAAIDYIQAENLLDAADAAKSQLAPGVPLTAAQVEAMTKLHRLTFKPGAAKTDELCQQIGTLLLAAGGPLPAKVRALPPMRPAGSDPSQSSGTGARTPAELIAAARQAPVSPLLRRQLDSLAAAATAGGADQSRAEETSSLLDVLAMAVDLVGPGQKGVPVQSEARAKIESQLADGLALFLDPRMRAAGMAKIGQLGQYRQMLDDVRHLAVPPGVQEKLGPAFLYAQRHVEQGPKLVQVVRQFLQLVSDVESLKPPVLPPVQKKVFDQMRQQFVDDRQAFLTDAAKLGDTSGFQAVTPEQLRNRLTEMSDLSHSLELIASVPVSLQSLASYKLRPTGALERRALVWVSAVGGVVQSPSPEDARQLLQNLRDLGDAAQKLSAAGALPPDVDKLYAHGHYAHFNSYRADRLLEMASLAAAGKDVDRQMLGRLQACQSLGDALREASLVETAVKQSGVLHAWVDWHVPADALDALLRDYREATATAVENVSNGDLVAVDRWSPTHDRLAPLLVLLRTAGGYTEQCRQLPTGWPGAIARLMTPMERQPFASERYASLMLAAWQHMNVGAVTSETSSPEPALILDAMNHGLRSSSTQPASE